MQNKDIDNKDDVVVEDVKDVKTKDIFDESLYKQQLKEKELRIKELELAIDEDKKKAYEKRDQAKENEKKALIEAGQFKEAYETLTKQFEEYKTQYNSDSFNSIKSKADDFDKLIEKNKEDLLSKLPDDIREDISDLPLNKIEKIVDTFLKDKQEVMVDKSKNGVSKNSNAIKGKKWVDMNGQERISLMETDPDIAKLKQKEYIKEKKK